MPETKIYNNGYTLSVNLVEKKELLGYVTSEPEEDSYRITDMYVAPAYRRRGYGRTMINTLSNIVGGLIGAGELYACYTLSEETEPFHSLLETAEFEEDEEYYSDVFSFTLADLKGTLGEYGKTLKPDDYVSLNNCPAYMWNNFVMRSDSLSTPVRLHEMNYYDVDHSFVLEKDRSLKACCLFSHGNDPAKDGMILDYMYSETNNPKEILSLLICCYNSIMASFSQDTRIYVNAVNQNVEGLIKKLGGASVRFEGKALIQSLSF